jgi:predicted AAA+ superfamily ATPase
MPSPTPYIERAITPFVQSKLHTNKVLLLYGTRRVGKTALAQHLANSFDGAVAFLNAEDDRVAQLFAVQTKDRFSQIVGNHRLVFLDEAQCIPDIGKRLKFLVDSFPEVTVVATGSSSFDLLSSAGEPLTGRQITLELFPLSMGELIAHQGRFETEANLANYLIYGTYPEVINQPHEAASYLHELTGAYLMKDLLQHDGIKRSSKLLDLLRLLAYQIGNEVSTQELGNQLRLSKDTVVKYLDLLSKVFVIFKIPGYSKNLRKEVVKSAKWYFVDNGVRNALIRDFSPLQARHDQGALWENFCISERRKLLSYRREQTELHFWRTYDQQELDLLEVLNGQLAASEFKWNPMKAAKLPVGFSKAYPEAAFECIHPNNLFDWLHPS